MSNLFDKKFLKILNWYLKKLLKAPKNLVKNISQKFEFPATSFNSHMNAKGKAHIIYIYFYCGMGQRNENYTEERKNASERETKMRNRYVRECNEIL